ncbi:hypothetical protein EWM64_g7384, partial [Hericium alpestre]
MRDLAREEATELLASLTHDLTRTFPALLIPPSSTADLSALLELKSGVGGSESSLFLADLLRMYTRFAHGQRWHSTVLASTPLDSGGIRDA